MRKNKKKKPVKASDVELVIAIKFFTLKFYFKLHRK